jgi:4-hydroxybenzoyl-CoA thioesterase
MLTNRRTVRIQFGDCDPHGIVFYPRYFEFFDACTDALFERTGLPRKKYSEPIISTGSPAPMSEPVSFGPHATAIPSSLNPGRSFSVRHKPYNEKVLAVEGVEKRVWVVPTKHTPSQFKSQAIPQEIVESASGADGRQAAKPVMRDSGS